MNTVAKMVARNVVIEYLISSIRIRCLHEGTPHWKQASELHGLSLKKIAIFFPYTKVKRYTTH